MPTGIPCHGREEDPHVRPQDDSGRKRGPLWTRTEGQLHQEQGLIAYFCLEKEEGVYVMKVHVESSGRWERGELVMNSGAAGNVLPRDILEGINMMERKEGISFIAANGKELKYHGQKQVRLAPIDVEEETFVSEGVHEPE
jgi:hypothetical protein